MKNLAACWRLSADRIGAAPATGRTKSPKVRGHFGKRAARLKDYAGLPGADTFLRRESAHAMDHAPIFSRVLPARQTRLLFAPQLV